MNLTISSGGMLLGAAFLAGVLVPWWHKSGAGMRGFGKAQAGAEPGGGRSPKALIAPALLWLYGMLLGSCVGGALGNGSRTVSKGSNQLGDDALHGLTGAPPTTVTHPPGAQVGAGAGIVILVGLLVLVLVWRKTSRQRHRDFGLSLLSGLSFAPAAFALTITTRVTLPALSSLGQLIVGRWM